MNAHQDALEYAAEHFSSEWPERCQEIVRRARAALASPALPAPEVPSGWKLVPCELTPEMAAAAVSDAVAAIHEDVEYDQDELNRRFWRAMLAAAPVSVPLGDERGQSSVHQVEASVQPLPLDSADGAGSANGGARTCVRCRQRPGDRVVIGTGYVCCYCATDDEVEL